MKAPSTQVFGFPTKGINKTFARSNQPQNTAYDMLNVLPFDRTGRLRGGKRIGTRKLWTAAIGTSTDSVLLSDQVTLIVPDGTVTADTPFVDSSFATVDEFAYTDGDLGTRGGSPSWQVRKSDATDAATYFNATTDTGALQVVGHVVTVRDAAHLVNSARYTPAVTGLPAATYVASLNALRGDTIADGNSVEIAIALRLKTSGTFGDGAILGKFLITSVSGRVGVDTVVFADSTGASIGETFFSADAGATILPDSITSLWTFEVRVNGDAFTAYVNGVQRASVAAYSTNSSETGLGFSLIGSNDGDIAIDNVTLVSGTLSGNFVRKTQIIAVANRDVFMGDIVTDGVLCTNGTDVIKKSVVPSGCYSAGKYFMVDGLNITQVDLASATVETYGTGGTIQGTPPIGTISCIWRDRLMIAGPDQNFYGSRVGDHFDWDYSQEDSAAAFVGNDSVAGHIGEPIIALMPLADDALAIGGDHDLHVFRGDPAAGGNIDLVSEAVGILGPKAWCKDPEGTVYFLGTGGLYKWQGDSPPVNIADMKWSQVFAALDRSRLIVNLVWDRDNQGMMIYLYKTGKTITDAPTHIWYDRRLDALFPVQYPVGHGPTSVLVYDGDGPEDRVTVLGCRDGYLRVADPAMKSDDGDAIVSRMVFGPIPLGDPNNDGIITRIQITTAEPPTGFTIADLNMTVTARAGLTAYDVTDRADDSKIRLVSRTYDGRQGHLIPMRERVKGAYGTIEISDTSDDRIWGFEQMVVDTVLAGFTRR